MEVFYCLLMYQRDVTVKSLTYDDDDKSTTQQQQQANNNNIKRGPKCCGLLSML